MKKFKISPSFFALVVLCFLTHNFILLINYFLALMLHEMAHFLVAVSKGYKLKRLQLSMCGLSLELNEEIDDSDLFLVNIAGPACNLLLALVCVAIFWVLPISFFYLKYFCIANLSLALFNLIPIYPLDGGKVFASLIKNKKHYLIFNSVLKYALFIVFLVMFVISLFSVTNYFYLIFSIFFLTINTKRKTQTLSVFKMCKKKKLESVKLYKILESESLYNLLKLIKTYNYTIFYCAAMKRYVDEDEIIEKSLRYPLTTKLQDTF